jgi:hypothetical protein
LLVLAPRVPWFAAVSVAAVAWFIGQLGSWSYYTRDVKMPRRLAAVQFVGGCAGEPMHIDTIDVLPGPGAA